MQFGGLNLAADAANTPEAVIASHTDFIDLAIRGKKTHLKLNGTAPATPIQGAAWYGTLILFVGGGNLYTLNATTGTVTLLLAAAFHATNAVSINTDGMPGYAIICDGVNTPKVWDGTTLRVMGPPAAPAAAPAVTKGPPTVFTVEAWATGALTAHAGATAAAYNFQVNTGQDVYASYIRLYCEISAGSPNPPGTVKIYESGSAFAQPEAGLLIATLPAVFYSSYAVCSVTLPNVVLKNGLYYLFVLTPNDVARTITANEHPTPANTNILNSASWYQSAGVWTATAGELNITVDARYPVPLPSGSYFYAYSYYNSTRVLESAMSPSAAISPNYERVFIPVLASTETGVNKIRLYRLGGAHSSYTLVGEYNNAAATLIDTASDGSLTVSATNIGNAKPPTALKGTVYLPDAGCIVGWKDDGILYASKQDGFPSDIEVFPTIQQNTIGAIANPIQGVVVNQAAILAVCANGAVKISGSDPANLYFSIIRDAQGTGAPRSISAGMNGGIYLGSEAVYHQDFNALPVKLAELRSKIAANFQNGGEVGFYWNKQFFLASQTAAEVLVYDWRLQGAPVITVLPLNVRCFFTDGKNLYFADSVGDIYRYEGGASRNAWDWQSVSQNLGDQFTKKNIEVIEFDYMGSITVTPYIDDVAQSTIALSSASRTRTEQAFAVLGAYRYQLRFQGTSADAVLYGYRLSGGEMLVTG